MALDWRSADAAEVDHEYSPSRFSKRPLDEYLREYAELSAPFAGTDTVVPGRPLLIYVHGGYWQRLSAADSLFNAAGAATLDRKSTRLNSSHVSESRMPSSA